jgi:hypothetical protein
MTENKATIFALFGIFLVILLLLLIPRAEAGRSGPFQIVAHANPNATASVFRLDTESGEVSYCYVPVNDPKGQVICSAPAK